jgi:hypothetical protein
MTKTRGQRAFEKLMKRKRAKHEQQSINFAAPEDEPFNDTDLDFMALEILGLLPEPIPDKPQRFAEEVEAIRAATIALQNAVERSLEEADRK